MPSDSMPWHANLTRHYHSLVLAVLLVVGGWLRWDAAMDYEQQGPDENLYGVYAAYIADEGFGVYPDMVAQYIIGQKIQKEGFLPPTRVFYISSAAILRQLTGLDIWRCLNVVSAGCSFLMLPIGYVFARRMAGPVVGLVTTGLMIAAPMQLMMAQHALIDITISLWALLALCALWEAMAVPGDSRRLIALAAAMAGLVLVKENSFFVVIGLGAVVVSNRWLKFGTVTPRLLLAMFVGLTCGGAILVVLSGGIGNVIEAYRLFVRAAYNIPFVVATGDGPWHRYLYELTLVSPWVTILALIGLTTLKFSEKGVWFSALFIAATYFIMANLPYGMNLRFANMWDVPTRFIAAACLVQFARHITWRSHFVLAMITLMLASYDLRQYEKLFVVGKVYEPLTPLLLQAAQIINAPK